MVLVPDRLYLGDCLTLLPQIPDASIDLVVTDPPFAIDFKARKANYNRKATRVLDGYQEVPAEEYYSFSVRWLREVYRCLKDSGSIYVVSGWTHLREILNALHEVGFYLLNHIIWKYQFGVFTRRRFVTSHYHILLGVKNLKKYKFNKIEHYPEDVWIINREYWTGKVKTPTKLPERLVEKMILYSSDPGDVVLDPFLGSGTTAVVAKKLSRRYIGIEIVPEYYELALRRLQQVTQPLFN